MVAQFARNLEVKSLEFEGQIVAQDCQITALSGQIATLTCQIAALSYQIDALMVAQIAVNGSLNR
ncbi:hypothetical protein Tco_0834394, partial [Tanacetum coccineum]